MASSGPRGAALAIHGGGPTPVLNASLAGAVLEGRAHSAITRFLGARFGVLGLMKEDFIDLSSQPAALLEEISRTPGSALGSCRRGVRETDYPVLLGILARNQVRFVFFMGGNGTMFAADRLAAAAGAAGYELRVLGIPKTIDNDLDGTDHAPGYGSAARFVACAVRDIGGDLWSLRERITVVETMGRNTGWLVAASALARHRDDDPPHLIYLPEHPVSEERIAADAGRVYARLGYCVIAVCEGQRDERGEPFGADAFAPDGFDRRLSANLGHTLARMLERRLKLRARSEKPGLLGRSSPFFISAVDRDEALICGRAAVQAALAGVSGKMITLVREPGPGYRCSTGLAGLSRVAGQERSFPREWIAAHGADVPPEFLEWVAPLAGEVPPRPRLEGC
jgi:6-phosphofructokinase 1